MESLKLLGVEVELSVFRSTDNVFTAYLTKADGTPEPLDASDVIFTVTDRLGGTVKHTQTNTPLDHVDALNGATRFNLPRTAFDGLTEFRAYTWKYHIMRRVVLTGAIHPFFYGDVRILTAPATPAPTP